MRTLIRSTPFLAILTCLLWSSAFFTLKIGLRYATPLYFAGIRFMLSGLLLMVFFRDFRKYIAQLVANRTFILQVALLQTAVLYALFYTGMNMVPAGISAVISGAGPLFVSLLAHFFLQNDRLSITKIVSVSLGVTGIILIGADRFNLKPAEAREFWGIMILVLANISSSMGNIVVARSGKKQISPVVLNSAQLFAGGLFLFIFSLFVEKPMAGPYPVQYYLSLFWLVCISAATYTIWFSLIRRQGVRVSELNVWKFMVPVFGAVFSWLVLPDEKPEVVVVAGMCIITVALLLLYHQVVMNFFTTIKQNLLRWKH